MARGWGICPSSGSYIWTAFWNWGREFDRQKSKNSNAREVVRWGGCRGYKLIGALRVHHTCNDASTRRTKIPFLLLARGMQYTENDFQHMIWKPHCVSAHRNHFYCVLFIWRRMLIWYLRNSTCVLIFATFCLPLKETAVAFHDDVLFSPD